MPTPQQFDEIWLCKLDVFQLNALAPSIKQFG
jgi:hypothetical protein